MVAPKIKAEGEWSEEKTMALTREEVLEMWGQAPLNPSA